MYASAVVSVNRMFAVPVYASQYSSYASISELPISTPDVSEVQRISSCVSVTAFPSVGFAI